MTENAVTEIVINSEQYSDLMQALETIQGKQDTIISNQADIIENLHYIYIITLLFLVVWAGYQLCHHIIEKPFEGI